MPKEKEVPFFHKDNVDLSGWNEYQQQYLVPSNGEKVVGTSTPQYMCDYRIPSRISKFVPEAKIIIILRDPIERAVSHFKMLESKGQEHRAFDQAIREQLDEEQLIRERRKTYDEILTGGEHDSYVIRGEYKRIVDLYLQMFPGAVLIVCSNDLKERREQVLKSVLEFLGVRSSILPENLSKEFHKSDVGFLGKMILSISKYRVPSVIARALLPNRWQEWFRQNYRRYPSTGSGNVFVSTSNYRQLANHFRITNEGLSECEGKWFSHTPSNKDYYVF